MKPHLVLAPLVLLLPPALGQEKETVESLVAQLGKTGSTARYELARRGEEAIPVLIKLLRDPKADQQARIEAALTLGKIGGEKVVEPLRSVLNDRQVGWAAIFALGDVGKPAKAAASDLAKIASAKVERNSPEGFLAHRATQAIAKIGHGSKEVIDVLVARMTEKRDHEAAVVLAKLGEPGAEALVALATKYSKDERPENERRYGEAYSVLAYGQLDKGLIPVFEKHVRANDDKAYISMRALASVGPPAKPVLLKLLEHENQDVVLNAADGLSWMNAEAGFARDFRKEKVEDPVSAEEVFPKLLAILRRTKDLTLACRITQIMYRLDREAADASPDVWRVLSEAFNEGLRRAAEEKAAKQRDTVWVYQRINGRWVKDESRTYVGGETTARKYVAEVKKHVGWTATSNLPGTQQ